MTDNRSLYHAGSLLPLFILLVLAACKPINPTQPRSMTSTGNIVPGGGNESYITASSFAELSSKSQVVVSGQVVALDTIVNMARNPKDPSQPDPEVFIVGQVYSIDITQISKGNIKPGMFYVAQREGFVGAREEKSDAAIARAKKMGKYVPMSVGKAYLMFLEPMVGFPEGTYYVGVAQPWRFALVNDCAYADSPWAGASAYFKPQPVHDFMLQVESAIRNPAEASQTPAYLEPGSAQAAACPPMPVQLNSYP